LELLLGIQGWRANAFDYARIIDVSNNIYNMPEEVRDTYQQVYAKVMYTNNIYYFKGGAINDAMPMP
jgi:hypothetical protein